MAVFVYDGDRVIDAKSVKDGLRIARDAISNLQDACDPEWPECVNQVAVYVTDSREKVEENDIDPVYVAKEVNRRPDPSGYCDYLCDFEMRTIRGAKPSHWSVWLSWLVKDLAQ